MKYDTLHLEISIYFIVMILSSINPPSFLSRSLSLSLSLFLLKPHLFSLMPTKQRKCNLFPPHLSCFFSFISPSKQCVNVQIYWQWECARLLLIRRCTGLHFFYYLFLTMEAYMLRLNGRLVVFSISLAKGLLI